MPELLINTSPEIGNNREIEPYRNDVYETYCLWKSLPAFFKFPPLNKKTGERPTPRDFCLQIGVEDERILLLCEIGSQRAFAAQYKVDENTLSLWNKKVQTLDSMEEIRKWATGLTKNVFMALYNKAVSKGDAFEVKTWAQLVEKWQEKAKVEVEVRRVETFTVIKPIEKNGTENSLGVNAEASASVGVPA